MALLERPPAAQCFRSQDDVDGVLVELFHDRRVPRRAPRGHEAERRVEHHARSDVQHGFLCLGLRAVAIEVLTVSARIAGDVAPEHGKGLRTDDMVRRRRALLREPFDIGALREAEKLRAVIYSEHEGEAGLVGDGAAKLGNLVALYRTGPRWRRIDVPCLLAL